MKTRIYAVAAVTIMALVTAVLIWPSGGATASPTGYEVAPEFRAFYERSGGLPVFGYAISDALIEDGRLVQYFQRQRFEHHVELAGTPYEILLGRIGASEARDRGLTDLPAFQPGERNGPDTRSCTFFDRTGFWICNGFRDYWHSYGLEFGDDGVSYRESLALFGYPISREFADPATGMTMQYFERARFEFHPEHIGTPYAVLLGHLGKVELERATVRGASGRIPPGQLRQVEEPTPEPVAQQSEPEPTPTPEPTPAPAPDPTPTPEPTPVPAPADPTPAGALNVMNFGAKGDGQADDTNAIKAALQQAASGPNKTVYLPAGTYMIRAGSFWQPVAEEIIVPDGVTLLGAGRDATKIKVIPSTVTNRPYQAAIILYSNTRVAELTLDGSKNQINRNAINQVMFQGLRIQPWSSHSVVMENVRIHDIIGKGMESFGTMTNGATNVRYRNIEAFNIEGTGVHIDGHIYGSKANNVTLDGAVLYNNTWAGVSVYGATDSTVRNVTAYGNSMNGINVEWSERIDIVDSTAYGNGHSGFGTFGWNANLRLTRVHLHSNGWNTWKPWKHNGEIGLRVGNYHTPNPNTGQIERGITQSVSVIDSTIQPPSGQPHLTFYYDPPNAPNPQHVVTSSGSGFSNWWIESDAVK